MSEFDNLPTTLPAHVLALRSQCANILDTIEDDALANLYAGAPPQIKLSGTRFIVSKDGEDRAVDRTTLGLVVLRAKGPFDKVFYHKQFNPGEEPAKPDCFSRDGVTPDPSVEHKCAASCAGCPKNQFGTGKNANGDPSDGKACRDIKVIAVTPGVDQGAYMFKIPPASLGAFAKYVAALRGRGIHLAEAITLIGFDVKVTYPKLTFEFGGLLDEKALSYALEIIDSVEVRDIIKAPAHVSAPVVLPTPEPEVVVHAAPEAVAPAFGSFDMGQPQTTEKPKSNRASKKTDTPASAADLGVFSGSPVQQAGAALGMDVSQTAPVTVAPGLSDADLASKLGL